MAVKQGILSIGTSNITIPGNKSTFPETYRDKSRLQYYASLFNSLEVNSSFYKVPLGKTFQRWTSEVPDHFQFTVKLFKGVTHNKGLIFEPAVVNDFLNKTRELGPKKGPLLIQFPKSITFDHWNGLEDLLGLIDEHHDAWRIAVEFRHPSWYVGETYELLDQHRACLVNHDMPGSVPVTLKRKAPFVYYRFHGEKGDYRGSYTDEHLEEMATNMKKLLRSGKDVYAYFNNTIGDAFTNARKLQSLVML